MQKILVENGSHEWGRELKFDVLELNTNYAFSKHLIGKFFDHPSFQYLGDKVPTTLQT